MKGQFSAEVPKNESGCSDREASRPGRLRDFCLVVLRPLAGLIQSQQRSRQAQEQNHQGREGPKHHLTGDEGFLGRGRQAQFGRPMAVRALGDRADELGRVLNRAAAMGTGALQLFCAITQYR